MEKVEETGGAKELLTLCAYLGPDDIPLDIIQEHPNHLPEELANTLTDQLKRNEAIKTLRSYSLIDKSENNISIHRLVQTVTRDQLTKEEQEEWKGTTTRLPNEIFPNDPQDLEARQVAERLSSHTEVVVEEAIEDESLAELLNLLGRYYQNTALYTKGEGHFKKALLIREKELGKEHPEVATSQNNLALLLQAQGKYEEAEPLLRRSLEISKKELGAEHPSVATSLNNLAGLLKDQGKYEEAEPLYRRSLEIKEKVLGTEHPSVATSLNNLAGLLKAQGKYEEAVPLLRRAMEIREKVLGEGHPNTITVRNNLRILLEERDKEREGK